MPTCTRCKINVGPFSFRSFSKQSNRCNKCDAEVERTVITFLDTFRTYAADGILTEQEWTHLKQIVAGGNVELNEALYYAYPDIIELIRRAVRLAIQDEVITEDEDRYLKYLIDILAVPEPYIQEVKGVLEEYKAAQQIRSGILPAIQAGTKYLDVGEVAHLECGAIYINTETKTLPRRQGVLTLTNQKLRFASPQTSFMVDWKKVNGVAREGEMIYAEMSIKKGNGFYAVGRPVLVLAMFTQLIKAAKAQPQEPRRKAAEKTSPPISKKTPHQILNIAAGASREDIVSAYREMAKLYHPDKVASLAPEFRELAEVKMKEINAAYQDLLR
ncbi:MAG TPA: J domain-containing protein [Pyrinomonadaceae bacterium]|nr:J domain-containing protein [Pyrinomonadaceae bacterium]